MKRTINPLKFFSRLKWLDERRLLEETHGGRTLQYSVFARPHIPYSDHATRTHKVPITAYRLMRQRVITWRQNPEARACRVGR